MANILLTYVSAFARDFSRCYSRIDYRPPYSELGRSVVSRN